MATTLRLWAVPSTGNPSTITLHDPNEVTVVLGTVSRVLTFSGTRTGTITGVAGPVSGSVLRTLVLTRTLSGKVLDSGRVSRTLAFVSTRTGKIPVRGIISRTFAFIRSLFGTVSGGSTPSTAKERKVFWFIRRRR